MKVREKAHPDVNMYSSKFNIHALAEVICHWEDGSADSMFIKDLDVFIEKDINFFTWKDMRQAFQDHSIITNNFNTCFFEPINEEDKERGFTL